MTYITCIALGFVIALLLFWKMTSMPSDGSVRLKSNTKGDGTAEYTIERSEHMRWREYITFDNKERALAEFEILVNAHKRNQIVKVETIAEYNSKLLKTKISEGESNED